MELQSQIADTMVVASANRLRTSLPYIGFAQKARWELSRPHHRDRLTVPSGQNPEVCQRCQAVQDEHSEPQWKVPVYNSCVLNLSLRTNQVLSAAVVASHVHESSTVGRLPLRPDL